MVEDSRRIRSAAHYAHLSATDALRAVVQLAARTMNAPVAMIDVVDAATQYTIVSHGMDFDGLEVPLSESTCADVIDLGGPLVVADVLDGTWDQIVVDRLHSRGFRAFIGVPLHGREGLPVGALCVLDREPLPGADVDLSGLEQCAVLAQQSLDIERTQRESDTARGESGSAVTIRDVATALDSGAITPWYMPIVDLTTNRLHAWEALARWSHPTTGEMTYPDAFLPVIENTDFIIDFDLAMLAQALADLRSWKDARAVADDVVITVNFSAHHFYRPDCVDRIEKVTREAGIAAGSVVLEITETTMISTSEFMHANVIDELRERGYVVVLDDIGGDWLPAKHLLSFAFDGLKADRSIGSALDTPTGRALGTSLATLSEHLGAFLVVEGIETEEHVDAARRIGARYGQGFYWSPAVPAHDVPGLFARG